MKIVETYFGILDALREANHTRRPKRPDAGAKFYSLSAQQIGQVAALLTVAEMFRSRGPESSS